MKRISLLQMVVLAALMVSAASCGLPRGASGDYYEETPERGNVYHGRPYSNAPNTVIVERDPITGRYYQVSPGIYGTDVYGRQAYPYGGRRYNNRTYNNRNSNARRNNGAYRTYPQVQQRAQTRTPQQPTPQNREEAREKILGKKRG